MLHLCKSSFLNWKEYSLKSSQLDQLLQAIDLPSIHHDFNKKWKLRIQLFIIQYIADKRIDTYTQSDEMKKEQMTEHVNSFIQDHCIVNSDLTQWKIEHVIKYLIREVKNNSTTLRKKEIKKENDKMMKIKNDLDEATLRMTAFTYSSSYHSSF